MSTIRTPPPLDEAMQHYLATIPKVDRLVEFLRQRGEIAPDPAIRRELDTRLGTASTFSYSYPDGVLWDDPFKAEFRALPEREHPWINQGFLDRLYSHSGWLCWHEGLNR